MIRKVLGLTIIVWALAAVVAQATVTGTYSVAIDPGSQTSLQFKTSTVGPIVIETVTSLGPSPVRFSLLSEGASEPLAKIEGSDKITLNYSQATDNTAYTVQIENIGTSRVQGRVNVTYPVAYCKEASVAFNITFSFSIGAQPLEADQCKVMLSVLSSLREPFPLALSRVEQVPPSNSVAGQYSPGLFPRIRVFGSYTGADLARIFFHEVGHHIQFKHFTDEQQTRWTTLHKESGNDSQAYARLYGMENEFEDWATVVELYTKDTLFEIERAQRLAADGKTILLEKYKFALQLLSFQQEGQAYTHIYRTDRQGFDAAVVNRATVPLGPDGLPVISGDISWEQF
ncbi:hypothetical protein HYR54_09600 [Candidatus Acetothermia bacterium]|nr:hypothetical protein [Candidatus Acetothermia bacterium]